MISNFNKMVNCELLITGIEQLDGIYSIITSYLCTSLNIFDLGAYDVSAEQYKSRKFKVGNDYLTATNYVLQMQLLLNYFKILTVPTNAQFYYYVFHT